MCKSIFNFSTSLIIGLYDTFNNGNVIIIQLNYLLVSLILFIWILSYCCILIFSISKNIFQTILPAPNVHIKVHVITQFFPVLLNPFFFYFCFFFVSMCVCSLLHYNLVFLFFGVLNVC